MTVSGSARFHRRNSVPSKPTPKPRGKCLPLLLSCCLFLGILCVCLLASLVLIGRHLYKNKSGIFVPEEAPVLRRSPLIQRLPNDTAALHYNLTLAPDLENGSFKGEVNITLTISRMRRDILVHSKNLSINHVDLFFVNRSKSIAVQNVDENEELELLTIVPNEELRPGVYYLKFVFNGNMLNKYTGFYKSRYKSNNETRSIATSKFEPTYARQAFPCFDEPNMKATYTVHILKPQDATYIALSNMPEQRQEVVANGVMVHFQESVKMSTYLSCFIVCDFESSKGMIHPEEGRPPVPIQVYATPAQLPKTAFALEVGIAVIEYFIKYFGIDYPLPKLDLIAIPDFVSGAMEHWGLVTFRETALLYSEEISSTANKQRVATVISHELAHSWFGNLVTMKWWNDLWLNEGFASYIEYKGVDYKFKDWQMMDQFLIDDLHSVLSLDSTPASHPIVQNVVTPDQITEIFDSITYNKGASILRMLEAAVTEDVFQRAVKNYLTAHQWGNAVTQDFLDEIQKLVDKDLDINEFMNTWTVQMGYPILDVKEEGENYILTQKRFLKDYTKPGNVESSYKYIWTIPVTYVTDQKPDEHILSWFNHDQPNLKIKKPQGVKWLKFNHNQLGYYRVNYGEEHWKTLINNIDNIRSISDKTHLLEESFSIAESGDLSYGTPLDLTKYLTSETNYIPWSVAATKLGQLKKYLVDSPEYSNYLKYLVSIVTPAVNELTWEEAISEAHLRKRARVTVLDFACASGHSDCLDEAYKRFQNWLEKPLTNPLSQDLRSIVYRYGMANSGKDEWEKVLELYKAEIDANEKLNLLRGLSSVKETWLLKRLIEIGAITGDEQVIRSQDYFTMLQYISANPIGEPIVWDYVRENWNDLVERFTINDRYLGRLIPAITKGFTMKIKLQEMETFFAENPNAGAGKAAREEALANVNNNIKWIANNRKSVEEWIGKNKALVLR